MIENLDKLVQFAQISGGINVQCQFQGEWLVQHQCQPAQAIAHIITEGEGWLIIPEEKERFHLQKGDIVFFSRSTSHTLSSKKSPSTQIIPSTEWKGSIQLRKISHGSGNELKLFCACFQYDPNADLFLNLPEYFWVNIPPKVLKPLLDLLQYEIEYGNTASRQIIDSLSHVLLIEIIRRYLLQNPHDVLGVLRGIQDHRLSHLISQIIVAPEQNWLIEKMAEKCHISRAQLMRLFKQKIGHSPHAFVHKIRLQKAALQLKNTAESILTIALSCGFQSETHFSKAFKTQYGVTPSVYRKGSIA